MICDICETEIETDYRTLNLRYEVKELPPPKPRLNPFKQSMKTTGVSFYSGDIWMPQYKELGLETFIDKAIICSNCEPKIEEIINELKPVFQKEVIK